MKILSSNDSEDWLLIRMKEMMKHKMMNRFHKRNSSSASYVDFKSDKVWVKVVFFCVFSDGSFITTIGGAMGILLVYDVTDESSFNSKFFYLIMNDTLLTNLFISPYIRNWIRNIEQHASDNVNKILVGNKVDMDESKRGQALADEYGIKFFETNDLKKEFNIDHTR
uniref:Uncharacterized protein n=1 Tax=Lactuca sativa TaxID=4236 RepID=A0A9R1UCB8_LACSA|nr:hypothetical protein LSAT_V11C900471990 [Lactuca sativa]